MLFSSEIQLKSPNWLFGQRKHEEGATAGKAASRETDIERSQAETKYNGFYNLNWLSSGDDLNEEDGFQRYIYLGSALFF